MVISDGENLKFVLSTVTTFSDWKFVLSISEKDASTPEKRMREINKKIDTEINFTCTG